MFVHVKSLSGAHCSGKSIETHSAVNIRNILLQELFIYIYTVVPRKNFLELNLNIQTVQDIWM